MPPRIMVATPSYDCMTHWRFTESLMAALAFCLLNRVEIELRIAARFTLVQFARNYLVQQFLEDDTYTHILWIDADLGFDPRAIIKLLEHDKDVVGGVYPVKTTPAWFPFEGTGKKQGGLLEATVLPTGFLMVSRKAMVDVAKQAPIYRLHHAGERIPCPHVFDLELVDGKGDDGIKDLIGEDVVLCHKLRKLGYDLWADPDISFRHCGMNEWAGNFQRTREGQQKRGQADLRRGIIKAVNG